MSDLYIRVQGFTCRPIRSPGGFEHLLDVTLLVGDLVDGDVHRAAAAVHHHVLAA